MKKFAVLIIGTLLVNSSYAIDDKDLYKKAILNAQVIEKEEILKLPPVPKGNIYVVTFEGNPKEIKSQLIAPKDIWVTLSQDLKTTCKEFPEGNLKRNIQKLLGLPPKKKEKQILLIKVSSDSLIRPCANPSIKEHMCGSGFPKKVSDKHIKWYKKNMKQLYKKGTKYPWTRLGYTCNWSNGNCEYGLPEFVIKKGVPIEPKTIHNINEFCSD